jgi:hypothetical protein
MASSSTFGDALSALDAIGVQAYELSQGQPAAVTVGPGGATIVQTGAAVTQNTIFYVAIIAVVAIVAYLLLR